jgi:peptidoglycan endopeptidase LytE
MNRLMQKRSVAVCLLFITVFFFVGYAHAAATKTPGSADTPHKASKKHRARVSTAARVEPVALGQGTASAETKRGNKQSPKGQKTKLRTAKKAPSQIGEVTTAEKDDGEYIQYRLKHGETLDEIAARFSIDKDEFIDLNQARKQRFRPGALVLIPKTDESQEEMPLVLNDRLLRPWKNEEERGILVKVAKSFAGAPYRYGGETVRGLDCSAFVKKMYEIFEVQLPRSAREQFCAGPRIGREDLVTGDLVFFRTKRYAKYPTHVGIYLGDDKFIHSSSLLSQGVKVDCLSEGYFARTYTGAVRIKAPPTTDRSQTDDVTYKSSGNS